MTTVIRLAADWPHPTNPDQPPPKEGLYLRTYDPDFGGGKGAAWWTDDPAEALTWEGDDALDFFRQTSRVVPLRPDGRPNRPLTALTVSIEQLP